MTTEETAQFNDPALKVAVQRAWGAECCPAKLRDRVCGLVDDADQPMQMRPWLAWGAAVAAVLTMAIILPVVHQSSPKTDVAVADSSSPNIQYADVLPASLQTELIRTHDRCAQKPNHQRLLVSMNNDAAMAAAMRSQLSRAVLVARPSQGNWTFKGAAVCQVASAPTGHLVFSSGDGALSIFSLPKSMDPRLQDGAHVETVRDGHSIAAFAKNGAVFCLVSSGGTNAMTVGELAQMRDRMEGDVTALTAADLPSPAVAELLYPIRQ